jgi:hypothetical protein
VLVDVAVQAGEPQSLSFSFSDSEREKREKGKKVERRTKNDGHKQINIQLNYFLPSDIYVFALAPKQENVTSGE